MKLNDFKSNSNKANLSTVNKRLGKVSQIKFVNVSKEKEYQDQLEKLTKKVIDFDAIQEQSKVDRSQREILSRQKALLAKALEALKAKFDPIQKSFVVYENREPRIKQIINQHRELNGQVAELQSKLQIAVEHHDEKIDIINEKILIIHNLKNTLQEAETNETKAIQSKLEALVHKNETQKNLNLESVKNSELSIINKNIKDELSEANEQIKLLNLDFSNSKVERDKAIEVANKIKKLGTKITKDDLILQAESKIIKKENKNLNSDIVEMTSIIKELQKDISFLSTENKEMFEELKKPRFASVAAISEREGFKFPTSFESRGNPLGLSKPTLLRKKG